MKYTEKELLECAEKLKEYCSMIHFNNPDYKGGYSCDYCIFCEKSEKHSYQRANGQIVTETSKEPHCFLSDKYGRRDPRFWELDTVKIDETLF